MPVDNIIDMIRAKEAKAQQETKQTQIEGEDQELVNLLNTFKGGTALDKFEYKEIDAGTPITFEILNELGKFGWELICVVPVMIQHQVSKLALEPQQMMPQTMLIHYFKRRII